MSFTAMVVPAGAGFAREPTLSAGAAGAAEPPEVFRSLDVATPVLEHPARPRATVSETARRAVD